MERLQENQNRESSSTLEGIKKNYQFYTTVSCGVFVWSMVLSIAFSFKTNEWSFGVILMLFLNLILAVLSIISLVAMYRELSRLHEKEQTIKKICEDFTNETQKRINNLEDKCKDFANETQTRINNLEDKCKTIEEKCKDFANETQKRINNLEDKCKTIEEKCKDFANETQTRIKGLEEELKKTDDE